MMTTGNRGRPSSYCPDKAQKIIEQLSDGIPLRVICRQEDMPYWRTVYDWIAKDEVLSAHIARARDLGYDAIAEECLDIADEVSGDYTETDKGMVYNAEHVQRSKLKIETRLKLLAKWNPKKYGDRIQQDVTLPEGVVFNMNFGPSTKKD